MQSLLGATLRAKVHAETADMNGNQEIGKLYECVCGIARDAGAAILEVYDRADFEVRMKSDDSPLTAADLAAHKVIVAGLEAVGDIPVLSEESDLIPWSERQNWDRYWLVDPLDGTKEFVSRNGEFTVNIALIDGGAPVLGVVYVPITDVLYVGLQGDAPEAWIEDAAGRRPIRVRSLGTDSITVMGSRRHGSDALEACLARLRNRFAEVNMTSMGSSLKICLVAAGKADLYPRLAPTCEWDTAAAQGVVEAAGGCVVDANLEILRYNTKDDLVNPHFYVMGDRAQDWAGIL